MTIDSVFDQYTFDREKASAYGFEDKDGVYTLKKPLKEDGFYLVATVTDERFEFDVYEEPGELYLPFGVRGMEGGFVGAIRAQADEAVADILKACFVLADVKALLLAYLSDRYGTVPQSPWGEHEELYTLNTNRSGKWYGLFMRIPYRSLGVGKEGKINVLNLKAKPDDIPKLIDDRHFFPAYHMNKKHWLSVLLDRDTDIEKVKRLLDDSYALVEKQPRSL